MKKILFISTSIILLVACIHGGTLRFTGPGNMQQFAQARYQCIQETSVREGGAYVNQYGGASANRVVTKCSVFDACLASKGYYRDPAGNLDASSIPIQCQ